MPSSFVVVPELSPLLVDASESRVLVRRTFAFWQSSSGVHGTIMWGRPDEADVESMCGIWDEHLRSPFGRHPAVADIRALDSVDLLAFERLVRVFVERRESWTALTGPQAIVHSGGLASAAILGAIQIAGSGYELGAFEEPGAAFDWAGRPEVTGDYVALRDSLLGQPDLVRRVRAALDESEQLPTIDELAARLGLSVRSLQRHLANEGTSIRELRARHLVARIERLLEGTELDLGAIAATLGLGSAGRLVTLFRAVHGKTPGEFRADRGSSR